MTRALHLEVWFIAASLAIVAACTRSAQDVAPVQAPNEPSVPALRGKTDDVTVIVFGAVDCPIANAYAPELTRIYAHCVERGAQMFYVYPADGTTVAAASEHTRSYKLQMPIVFDPRHEIVRALGATVTPEAAVLRFHACDQYELVYRGRIDDWYAGLGKRRATASTHELEDAINAALEGRAPPVSRTEAFGCFIEKCDD